MATLEENGEKIAVLESRLQFIEQVMLRMETKLDTWQASYPTRAEVNEMFRARDKEIDEVKQSQITSKQLWPVWVGVFISAIALIVTIYALLK